MTAPASRVLPAGAEMRVVRDNSDVNEMIASHTALGRVGLPEDIGGVVASLLSPEMGWVNAQRIEASGGQNL